MKNTLAAKNFLYWTGITLPNEPDIPDEDKNPREIFRNVENGGTGSGASSISVVMDNDRGKVWLFDKPADPENYRCESHGIRLPKAPAPYTEFAEGEFYDIAWSSRLPETHNQTYGDYVIFQWKSYAGIQNYPFLFLVNNHQLTLVHSNHDGHWVPVWLVGITANVWFDIRVRVGLSQDKEKGSLELYFNNVRQAFTANRDGKPNGSDTLVCRTLDGPGGNYPKWGAYNRDRPGHAIKHYVDRMSIKRIR